MNISDVVAVFVTILIASGALLYIGTIGLKGNKQQDHITREAS